MKNTRSKRNKSNKRHRKTKRRTRCLNFSFAIQLIACAIVLYYIVLVTDVKPKNFESAQEIEKIVSMETIATEPIVETIPEPVVEVAEEPIIENPLPLEIHQIAVGQANAYLIRCDDFTVFVDGGRSRSYEKVKKYLDNFGVETVDVYIATHWHGDHVENMSKILLEYAHENTIVYGTTQEPSSKYEVTKGTYIQMVPGTNFNIGDVGFLCVGPDEILHKGNENPDSLNILIQYNDFKFLMTADYIKDAAIEMFGEFLRNVDIIQMPHHGLQPFRISEMAMLYCNPEVMLVPVDNSYDSRHFLKTLELKTKVYDNKDGCIAIVSYGDDYEVYTNVKTPNDII
jgi:competence protein ComEC